MAVKKITCGQWKCWQNWFGGFNSVSFVAPFKYFDTQLPNRFCKSKSSWIWNQIHYLDISRFLWILLLEIRILSRNWAIDFRSGYQWSSLKLCNKFRVKLSMLGVGTAFRLQWKNLKATRRFPFKDSTPEMIPWTILNKLKYKWKSILKWNIFQYKRTSFQKPWQNNPHLVLFVFRRSCYIKR